MVLGELREIEQLADFECAPLSPHEVCVVARAGHPLTRKPELRAADLFDWPLAGPNLPEDALRALAAFAAFAAAVASVSADWPRRVEGFGGSTSRMIRRTSASPAAAYASTCARRIDSPSPREPLWTSKHSRSSASPSPASADGSSTRSTCCSSAK